MQSLRNVLLYCFGALLLLAIPADAQMSYLRPTGYTNTHAFQPCGGNNAVTSTVDFSPVYTGKTAAPPVNSPQATLYVSGASPADPNTGNQTWTSFTFTGSNPPAGNASGVKVYYSVVTSNTACGYLLVEGKHKNGSSLQLQISQIGSGCYNNPATCNFPIPDDADLTSLVVSFAIQSQANNPTNPANAVIFDVWVGYGMNSCPK